MAFWWPKKTRAPLKNELSDPLDGSGGEIFPTSNKITYKKIRWPFSLEGFCSVNRSCDILKSSVRVISGAPLCRNRRVTKHRWMEYVYISWYFSWTSDPSCEIYWILNPFFFFTIFAQAFGIQKDWNRIATFVTEQTWTLQVVKIKYALWPCCTVCKLSHIILWCCGFIFEFSHNFLSPYLLLEARTPQTFLLFIHFSCQPWLDFFLYLNFRNNLVLKMTPSWTSGAGTLLAALGLLSFYSFGYCEDLRTRSSTSGGRKEDHGPSSLERVKRGWVWNQFFVVEEYTGTEPLYVGKVRHSLLFLFLLNLLKSFSNPWILKKSNKNFNMYRRQQT